MIEHRRGGRRDQHQQRSSRRSEWAADGGDRSFVCSRRHVTQRPLQLVSFGLAIIAITAGLSAGTEAAIDEPRECACDDLRVLQAELRNALLLQKRYQDKIPELRAMSAENSTSAFHDFAKNEAPRGISSPSYTGPAVVDYEPEGNKNLDLDHGPQPQLCRRSGTSQSELQRAEEGSACKGIGHAIRVHEDFHLDLCSQMPGGFPAYFWISGADRAQEEANAYAAQANALRQEIARVLAQADIRVDAELDALDVPPPNPFYTRHTHQIRSDAHITRVAMANDMIRLDGEGRETTNMALQGNCHFINGVPFSLPARVTIETDGFDVQVQATVDGTPSIGFECNLDGRTIRRTGIPVMGPAIILPLMVNLPLKLGVAEASNTFTVGNAQGSWKYRLTIDCSSRE